MDGKSFTRMSSVFHHSRHFSVLYLVCGSWFLSLLKQLQLMVIINLYIACGYYSQNARMTGQLTISSTSRCMKHHQKVKVIPRVQTERLMYM